MPHARMGSFTMNNVFAAMRRALQLGAMYDESEYANDSSNDEINEKAIDIMGDGAAQDGGRCTPGGSAKVVAGTCCEEQSLNKNDSMSMITQVRLGQLWHCQTLVMMKYKSVLGYEGPNNRSGCIGHHACMLSMNLIHQ
ncbi:hypothetical protein ACP70R_009472 [Stipagrostis hirtigluma subsp. patula]